MTSLVASPVDIRTCPQDVPSIPPWFAELILLARHLDRSSALDTIREQVRLARGRAGHYDVIDVVALLVGYAVSGEPTLEAYSDRLQPFARPFMALFGRDRLPHRSTLSRCLAAVDGPCPEALRGCFERDLAHHGVAQQRALVTDEAYLRPRRRLAAVCAPCYLGHKRGEVVRTCTAVLQAHTQQRLGTFLGRATAITGPSSTPPAAP